jgi:malonyl-CoA O-methyltransferase
MNKIKLVQQNFDRAAANYLKLAKLQNTTAQKLVAQMSNHLNSPEQIILDLGSGAGTFNHQVTTPQNLIISLDVSRAMLRQNHLMPAINADAAYIPLKDNSVDLIISNLMLQWPENKPQVFGEINRILKPNGVLVFTTLIKPSLHQLIDSFANIDNQKHTLDFLSSAEYQDLLLNSGFTINNQQQWCETFYFSDILSLFRHFGKSGTSLPAAQRNGLGGKSTINKLEQIYPRDKDGFALSYHYLMLTTHTIS